jgi:tRNA threonylcarbamoyl adenosine modification protein YeaZ
MNIIAVDGTGAVLTVALSSGARVYSASRRGKVPHDESLLPAVESLLRRAKIKWKDLDAVAAASGPGRFTGIRIGMSFAAMIGLTLDVPVLAVSRLEAAAVKSGADEVLAAVPGWKDEVYHQNFERKAKRMVAAGAPMWTSPADWPAVRDAWVARKIPVAFGDTDARDLLLAAQSRLDAKMIPPFEPFYLKPAGYEKPRR